MSSAGPGRLVIFNHQEFQSDGRLFRDGSDKDVTSLREVFGKYNVRSIVFNNLTKDQVKKKMDKIADFDYSNKSCLIIAILSHGGLNDSILGSGVDLDKEFYSIQNEIINPIIRNRTLHDKPKIIIVQACKGEEEILHIQDHVDSVTMTPSSVSTSIMKMHPNPDQLYKFYSTTESFVAYREDKGSRFIQTFCEILDEHGEKTEIEEIMTFTYKKVKELSNGRQLPSKTCTAGDKKFIFGQHVTI